MIDHDRDVNLTGQITQLVHRTLEKPHRAGLLGPQPLAALLEHRRRKVQGDHLSELLDKVG